MKNAPVLSVLLHIIPDSLLLYLIFFLIVAGGFGPLSVSGPYIDSKVFKVDFLEDQAGGKTVNEANCVRFLHWESLSWLVSLLLEGDPSPFFEVLDSGMNFREGARGRFNYFFFGVKSCFLTVEGDPIEV